METEALIRKLADGIEPVPPRAVERRLGRAVAGGASVTLILVVAALGLRPDLAHAMVGGMFWLKLFYTGSIGLGALVLTAHLARPEATRLDGLRWLLIPIGVMAAVGLVELIEIPASEWSKLWMGRSWKICPFLIFGLAVPIYLCLIVAFRRFAPTRLTATGAVAGLASGGLAATVYCLHCPEASALFVLTWYAMGMALAALAGGLAGKLMLRW